MTQLFTTCRFLAVMNPFRYKQYMNSGKVLTLTVVYCLSIVVMPSVASDHYSNSKALFVKTSKILHLSRNNVCRELCTDFCSLV